MPNWKKVITSGSDAQLNSLKITGAVNANTDTDKFLVLDTAGNVDFRTGAQVLSDIGGVGSSNGITGEGSFGSIGYSQNGTDYYSLARFSGSTSNVTGSSELEFFIDDTTLVAGPVRKGITFGRNTGERTYFDETGFVVSQGTNTNGLPQDTVNVLLQENGSGDTYFSILTGGSSTLALGTGDSHRLFITGSSNNGNGGTRIGIGGFSGDANPFGTSGENIDDTLHIKGGLKVEKPTTSGTSAGVNFATNVRITGSLIVSASNTFINQGPAQFSGSVNIRTSDQVQATTDTDKFVVLDGKQLKYRSGVEVYDDIGVTALSSSIASDIADLSGGIITPIQLTVDCKATAAGHVPWSSLSDLQANPNRAYTTWIAPTSGYLEKVIVSPEQTNTTAGTARLQFIEDGTTTETISVTMGAAGTNKTFTFTPATTAFSAGDRLSLKWDKLSNTADLYNLMVVFRLSN